MKLYIDTTKNTKVEISIQNEEGIVAEKEFEARFSQAEKLLPEINNFLTIKNISLSDLKEIRVNSKGASFTALRIGVLTANALAYALGVPVKNFEGESQFGQKIELVKPEYDREPDITLPKKK